MPCGCVLPLSFEEVIESMSKILAVLLILLSWEVLLVAQTATASSSQLAFTQVTVIDLTDGSSRPDMTVVIEGNRIVAVGKRGTVRVPRGAQVIDARGKFLIPGLWDMHVHSLTDNRYEYTFPLLIANGVTGVREMGSNLSPEKVNQVRQDVLEGRLLGPRFGALTYKILDGLGTQTYTATAVTTPEEGRQFVRTYKQLGADFIKPYNLLSREVYLAIIDEAKRLKIPVEGHVPFSMTAEEVSDLGQLTIEHNFDVLISTSSDEDALRRVTRANPGRWPAIEAKAAGTFDEQKAKDLFARFVRHRTWSCPTMIVYRQIIHLDDESFFLNDSQMKYIPRSQRERWHQTFEQIRQVNLNAENKKRWEMRSRIVGMMHRAGVRLIAGTDSGAIYVIPGFSIHDELQLMVDAGLSTLTVLQAATINPAKFLGKEKELGTIEKGRLADFVLLEANPLKNIKNTRRIAAVVVNGQYLPKESLQRMLEDVEAKVNKK
jgi:imidazolonepropionase-like amidohydrolase